MTEPKRWDWKDDVVRLRDDLADARLVVGALRRDNDRLRDERDRLAEAGRELARNVDVLLASSAHTPTKPEGHFVTWQALTRFRSVFDTLTEEKA